MRVLSLAAVALLCLGCDGNDISDDQQVFDASAGTIDSTPPSATASRSNSTSSKSTG